MTHWQYLVTVYEYFSSVALTGCCGTRACANWPSGWVKDRHGDWDNLGPSALASIGALLVLPENYGGRDLPMAPHFAYLLSKDAQMRTLVDAWRRTDVGAYILRLYKNARTK